MARTLASYVLLAAFMTGGVPHCLAMLGGSAAEARSAHHCCEGEACDVSDASASLRQASAGDCCVLDRGPSALLPVARAVIGASVAPEATGAVFSPAAMAVIPAIFHPPGDGPPGAAPAARYLLHSVFLI
ncbi:MAG TPA: hypothetical protein VLA20_08835 [Vicinamibacterales bacterium]|nr:hypothetical protein [Vicinamibacterales bacterium]